MDKNRQLRFTTAVAVGVGALTLFGAACGTTGTDAAIESESISPLAMTDIEDANSGEDPDFGEDAIDSGAALVDPEETTIDSGVAIDPEAAGGSGEVVDISPSGEDEPVLDLFVESPDEWDITVLGPAMVGDGDFVQLIEPASSSAGVAEESECISGWLGIQRSDGRIHRYEDLGRFGYLRLFNGPRGQDAVVASCEESVERVLVQGSALVPEDGVPRFVEFPLGEPYLMNFFADFGWRGDLFGGYAWSDGWDELVYFDTGSQLITEASVLLGTREDRLDDGFDFILPDGWEVESTDPELGQVSIHSGDGAAWMIIEPVEWAGDPEFPEGVEPLGFWSDQVPLWDYVSAGRASRAGVQDRPTWALDTGDGTRTVMHLEGGEIDLIVDFYVADTETWMLPIAQAAAEQIRVYRQPPVG